MNRIVIAEVEVEGLDKKTHFVPFSQANDLLTILRSDYFESCTLHVPAAATNAKLRFLMHFSRLLTQKGKVRIEGSKEGVDKTKAILKNMGMFLSSEQEGIVEFLKKKEEETKKEEKLAIGFKSQAEGAIDEEELLKNEGIKIQKKEGGSCADKPRACANCNCGRKKDGPLPSKEELVKAVNEGKPVSGCGSCFLGDKYRCATCPYQGMPAFKPGDKLKLVDESKVVVESGNTVVEEGKVKIEL